MIDHMVWFQFKADVPQQRIEEHIANLNAMNGRIPGMIECIAGRNFTNRAGDFTHGLRVTLEDRAALDAYLPHPEHLKVALPLKEDAQAVMAMDIEITKE